MDFPIVYIITYTAAGVWYYRFHGRVCSIRLRSFSSLPDAILLPLLPSPTDGPGQKPAPLDFGFLIDLISKSSSASRPAAVADDLFCTSPGFAQTLYVECKFFDERVKWDMDTWGTVLI